MPSDTLGILLISGSYDRAHYAFVLACGAAAVARDVVLFATNDGCHALLADLSGFAVDEAKTTALIDSPGFQEFGLNHIEASHLASYMPDFKVHVPNCKFYNCSHLHEPGCGVLESMKNDVKNDSSRRKISLERYRIYSSLFAELSEVRY